MTLLLLLLCAVSSLTVAQDSHEDITLNANEYVDRLLREARESEFIREKINPVKVKHVDLDDGKGYVENITIYGLPSLAREGNVSATSESPGAVGIVGILRAEDLRTAGRYLYRPSRFFRLRGGIAATLGYIAVEIGIVLDSDRNTGNVTTFRVADAGKIKVTRFTGASFAFNWLGKFIVNKILNGRSAKLYEQLEEKGKDALNRLLAGREISFN